jgi:hypothetical protein
MQWRQNHYDLQRVPQALGGCPFAAQFAMGDCRAIPQSDADGHLQLCRQRVPDIRLKVVFALPDRTDLTPHD